jgi:hypothetical protein
MPSAPMRPFLLAPLLVLAVAAPLATAAPAEALSHAPQCTSSTRTLHMTAAPQRVNLSCTDRDGDPMRITVLDPALGHVQNFVDHGDGTGTVDYVAPPFYFGSTPLVYRASDGALVSATADVWFTFTDSPPACDSVAASTHHLRAVTIPLHCTDPDGDVLRYAISTPPDADKGHVSAPDGAGRVTFTPNPAFTRTARFRFAGSDGAGADAASVAVSVTNREPTCSAPRRLVVPDDKPSTISVRCTDPDGDPLQLVADTPPAYGALSAFVPTGSTYSATYTPGEGYVGGDRFTVRVSDGADGAPEITVPLSVAPPGAVDTAIRSNASDILDHLKLGHMALRRGRLRLRTVHGAGAGSRLKVKLSHRRLVLARRTITVAHGATKVSVHLTRRGRRYVARHRSINARLSLTLVSAGGGKVNDWRMINVRRSGKRYRIR